ncbi:glycoside hydrolase family 95 protein [Belliella sp. R4-6]|uniref:Glycoside hydrolase family 95 protein n=1 Tax=Belliella alkalica TaxID=1730871 RepID=A0ABS9VES5_9BACT|nr:glycoside hydrolase family 95 protein [Belliella alkalica]MCH7414368.1 glycoside hydrolase family 95 protein [Belliella alkalica]
MLTFFFMHENVMSQNLKLIYESPADPLAKDYPWEWRDDKEWLKALPIGNGFLGGMIFGGVHEERIQLSEHSMWSGSPQVSDNPNAILYLDSIRTLLFDGKYAEATQMANKTQIAEGKGSDFGNGAKSQFGSFQKLGDLWLSVDHSVEGEIENYNRELDLSTGIVSVTYSIKDVNYFREYFCSYPDQVMVMRLTSDKPNAFSLKAKLDRPERFHSTFDGNDLIIEGALDNGLGEDGLSYQGRLRIMNTSGNIYNNDTSISTKKTDDVVLIFGADTDHLLEYPSYNSNLDFQTIIKDRIDKASQKKYCELMNIHMMDHSNLFDRVKFNLNTGRDGIETESMLENFKNGNRNPHLYELLFQYGRYLLIASSRPGSLPANLQGVWTNKLQSPWNGDYHTDVNLEMNYWPTEVTNLPELHTPLFDLIKSLVEPGRKTAQVHYQANGWIVHPITNIWGYTSPGEEAAWGMHTGATAWISQHIMEHYRFTQDIDFLKNMYSVLEEATEFYLDWLVKDPVTGFYVSGPAVSPENSFIAKDGTIAQISMGPTHDHQVIRRLFKDYLESSTILNIQNQVTLNVGAVLAIIAENKIGKDGRLMEWSEDFEEAEPGHRHISHLFDLHPGNEISPLFTPQLADAAEKSIETRLKNGGGNTGWSATWLVSQFARLYKGEQAIENLNTVIANSTAPNLFGYYPPFQMDANFGITAGIAEMLLQSHTTDDQGYHIIHLLPALPDSWPNGEICGLKARSGVEVNLKWKDGKLEIAELTSKSGLPFKLFYKGKIKIINPNVNEKYKIKSTLLEASKNNIE